MKNYICIEGKCAELTPEQLKALGIEVKEKSPFDRADLSEQFYFIGADGSVCDTHEHNINFDLKAFDVANYCTDKSLMEQRALHEILNRLLWRYSMEHDGGKIEWFPNNNGRANFKVYYNHAENAFCVTHNDAYHAIGSIYFYEEKTARNAIKEIVEPFMKEHPEFKW